MLPLRLLRVEGHAGRRNDVLFRPAAGQRPPDTNHTLVFFGGDVQDYSEIMLAHRDNRNYVRWSLEGTARALADSFPRNHILVVRPSRIEYRSFSCYDNFVPSNNAGAPDHTPNHGALLHLERLLQGVSYRLKSLPPSELIQAMSGEDLPDSIDIQGLRNTSIHRTSVPRSGSTDGDVTAGGSDRDRSPATNPLWWRDVSLNDSLLTLVGFSKGCVVLNQFIYEFHYTKTLTPGDEAMSRFIDRVCAMCWLDGGHAGAHNTWVTARSLLETLARLDLSIVVHVSPYQVLDAARPWIGREERAFTHTLSELGANITRFLHRKPGQKPSLQMHFDVLDNFKRVQDSNSGARDQQ